MNCYIKDYPRLQLVRKEWKSLNGKWNFVFDDNDEGNGLMDAERNYKIEPNIIKDINNKI